MARKHLLANIGGPQTPEVPAPRPSEGRAEYARRGASRSMMQTLDEMAENSMRLLEGEAIVQLDPALLDPSPYADRLGEDAAAFSALVAAIRDIGQSSPILVRPNPDDPQRYIIVYGHRRARAARELGIPVRAIVKALADINHVIAQGQENTARSNLSFIEKALFAKKLLAAGLSKDDIKRALTLDDTLLSRMLAVVDHVPVEVLEAIGAARGVGRDRWEQMKKDLLHPEKLSAALDWARGHALESVPADQRFSDLAEALRASGRKKPPPRRQAGKSWSLADSTVQVATRESGRTFTLSLTARTASGFGAYLCANLDRLYAEFQQGAPPREPPVPHGESDPET